MIETEGRRMLPVRWQDLLDAHRSPQAADLELAPVLRLDTGEVSCRMMLGAAFDRLDADDEVLLVPVKGAKECWEQRRRFTLELCDAGLRDRLAEALSGPAPFADFDTRLQDVPIELTRWLEVERLEDTERLYRWLGSAGFEPDPAPNMQRKIIEFPFQRVSAQTESPQ